MDQFQEKFACFFLGGGEDYSERHVESLWFGVKLEEGFSHEGE